MERRTRECTELDRIRRGRATPADIEIGHSRTFGHPDGPNTTDAISKAAPLVTPRNSVRLSTGMEQIKPVLNMQWTPGIRSLYLLLRKLEYPQTIAERRWYGLRTRRQRCLQPGSWAMLGVGAVAVTTTNMAVELRVANGTK